MSVYLQGKCDRLMWYHSPTPIKTTLSMALSVNSPNIVRNTIISQYLTLAYGLLFSQLISSGSHWADLLLQLEAHVENSQPEYQLRWRHAAKQLSWKWNTHTHIPLSIHIYILEVMVAITVLMEYQARKVVIIPYSLGPRAKVACHWSNNPT